MTEQSAQYKDSQYALITKNQVELVSASAGSDDGKVVMVISDDEDESDYENEEIIGSNHGATTAATTATDYHDDDNEKGAKHTIGMEEGDDELIGKDVVTVPTISADISGHDSDDQAGMMSGQHDISYHSMVDAEMDVLLDCSFREAPKYSSSKSFQDDGSADGSNSSSTKQVRFKHVQIREFSVTIGDHPFCTSGVPIQLDWSYYEFPKLNIDLYESARRRRRRNRRRLLLNAFERRDMLWRSGHELDEIDAAAKKTEKENFRRSMHLYFLPIFVLQEFWVSRKGALRGLFAKRNNTLTDEEDGDDESVIVERQVRNLHQIQLASIESAENGGLPPWRQHQHSTRPRHARRISFRSSSFAGSDDGDAAAASIQSEADWSAVVSEQSSRSFATPPDNAAGEYHTTGDSNFSMYHIMTDPRQHDKATEIILCSTRRPHMRAFHGSWFGFFIGFIMWFAITPLLGEVKEVLDLSNQDIWTSSMAGTAVTVIARIVMGPLCDVFGARVCMAAIVIISAVPCGLTGLVNTAAGLSTVRAFIGIGGSAFVPCQYWTSRMFAREVAGTANALVAGWGNLGGGVTQLLMGSALFPLFKLMFSDQDSEGDDSRSTELALRTVFVVPALIAFLAGYVYIYHCDDSPKGAYSELVRQQQIELVSPFMSLVSAIRNRNVLLLLVQYACCFGVEITMTNATALYMKDKFGLDTAAAAATASVFGFMNLFARGLGGYGSDYWNKKYGTKGRVVWLSITLFVEGVGIILFAFTDVLIWAIFALIFLSLWVQCSEGATYGIVPYVNRRFTGAVVGWVGGGGTIGGVIFSFFFREMSYQNAFLWMGVSACASSFLSIFMNLKSLAAIYEEKMKAEHIKNNNNFVFHDDAPAYEETPPKTADHHDPEVPASKEPEEEPV